jgi:hypothetical protein
LQIEGCSSLLPKTDGKALVTAHASTMLRSDESPGMSKDGVHFPPSLNVDFSSHFSLQ